MLTTWQINKIIEQYQTKLMASCLLADKKVTSIEAQLDNTIIKLIKRSKQA